MFGSEIPAGALTSHQCLPEDELHVWMDLVSGLSRRWFQHQH